MTKYSKIEQMVHEKALKKKLFLGPLRQASGQKNVEEKVNIPEFIALMLGLIISISSDLYVTNVNKHFVTGYFTCHQF